MTEGKTEQVSVLARGSMLRMATTWQSLGWVNQASGVYLRLLESYPETREAEESRERLLQLAACFEQSGRFRLAMGLYDKIDQACR